MLKTAQGNIWKPFENIYFPLALSSTHAHSDQGREVLVNISSHINIYTKFIHLNNLLRSHIQIEGGNFEKSYSKTTGDLTSFTRRFSFKKLFWILKIKKCLGLTENLRKTLYLMYLQLNRYLMDVVYILYLIHSAKQLSNYSLMYSSCTPSCFTTVIREH